MKIKLKRIALKKDYTIGKLYIDDVYFCDTLEDAVRDLNKNGKFDNGEKKIYSQTAIPHGTYEVMDVPQFEGIRIHAGSYSKDTEGCILLGENKKVGMVLNSRVTINKFYPIIKDACSKGKVTIEIV